MSANISIFVPHAGCPHKCSFCNQYTITSYNELPNAQSVENILEEVLRQGKNHKNSEIAYFGGSFTAIDTEYREELLAAASKYVKQGYFKGIRISTRPDYINDDILMSLKCYGVTSIELGAQSMVDRILQMNMRGHTAKHVEVASKLIKEYGFELGLQMMTGLYGSSVEDDIYTAEKLISLKPDTIRIYPTITMKNTYLEKLFNENKYLPPSLDETVILCSQLINMFERQNIKIIKLGLHASEDVVNNYVAGPYHPSLRELCEGKVYLNNAKKLLSELEKGSYIIKVSKGSVSKMIGQNRKNIIELINYGYICTVIEDDNVEKYQVIIEKEQ